MNIDLQAVKSYMILRLRFSETDGQQCFAPVESHLFECTAVTEAGIEVTGGTDVQVKRLITAATTVDRTSEVSQLLSGFTSSVTDHILVNNFTLYYLLMLDDSDWKTVIKPAVSVKTPRQFIRACLTAIPANPINPNAFRFIKWVQLIPKYGADAAVSGDTTSSLLAQYMAEAACTDDAVLVELPFVENVPSLQPPAIEPSKTAVKPEKAVDKKPKTVEKQSLHSEKQPKTGAVKNKPVKNRAEPILSPKKKKRRRTV